MLVEAVLVLREDGQIAGQFAQGDDFLALQFGNVVEHLVLLDLQTVFLHGLHDAHVGGCRVAFVPAHGVTRVGPHLARTDVDL